MMSQEAGARSSRRDPWRAAFFVVAVVALIGGVAWALLGSSLFVVRSVQVLGAGQVPRDKVLAAAAIRIGTPLVRVDTSAVARRVAEITQVQSVRVRTSWPDAVVIMTVPRTAVFAVRAGRRYDVMDSYGVILGRTVRPRAGLVLLKSPPAPAAALRGNAAVFAAGTVIRHLPAWLRHRVRAVRAASAARVILILRGGVTVIWGGTGRGAAKAEEVALLLRTRTTYVDVSDPQSAVTGGPAGQAPGGE
jgi:cell division protein FtsQ